VFGFYFEFVVILI